MESVSVLNAPQPGSSGTITVSGPGTQLTVTSGQQKQAFFDYDANVTIAPSPTPGSAFIGWSGDCSGFGSCVIAATKSFFIEGSFAVAEALRVQLTGKGSGTVTSSPGGLDCPSACSAVVGAGAAVTLTAKPAPGSYFADWSLSGGCGGATSPCAYDMPSSDDLEVAEFRLDHCLVPSVRHLTLGNARSRLGAYSCRAGAIVHAYSPHVKKGLVISQRPNSGTRLAKGAKVRLVLSRGKRRPA
jgi:PASTA domain/Divergent InlB B-repeat domain